MLLATNRPFDLDPAVLGRAPMQIHLDIPTPGQRQGILKIILKDEKLAPDVTLEKLVKLTSRYTGSDLKNMCVTAATECVGELKEDSQYRTVQLRHFKSAMINIKATGLSKTMEHDLRSFGENEKPGAQPGSRMTDKLLAKKEIWDLLPAPSSNRCHWYKVGTAPFPYPR